MASYWLTRASALAAIAFLGACAVPEPAPVLVPEALVAEVEPEEPEPQPAPEPDLSLEERWRSPFAVSSQGRTAPRTPRSVVVIGADSAIAAALAEQLAVVRRASGATEDRPASTSVLIDTSSRSRGIAEAPPSTAPRASGGAAGGAVGGASAAADPSTGRGSAVNPPVVLLGTPARSAGDAASGPAATERPIRAAAAGETLSGRSAAEAPSGGGMGLHRVERGDTWSGIAVRYRVSARALGEANPDVDPDLIRIGQTLLIPTAAPTSRARSHRVGPGDTLSSIARRYGVPASEIRRLNDMRNEVVRLGQTLVIPPAEATDPPGR